MVPFDPKAAVSLLINRGIPAAKAEAGPLERVALNHAQTLLLGDSLPEVLKVMEDWRIDLLTNYGVKLINTDGEMVSFAQ